MQGENRVTKRWAEGLKCRGSSGSPPTDGDSREHVVGIRVLAAGTQIPGGASQEEEAANTEAGGGARVWLVL